MGKIVFWRIWHYTSIYGSDFFIWILGLMLIVLKCGRQEKLYTVFEIKNYKNKRISKFQSAPIFTFDTSNYIYFIRVDVSILFRCDPVLTLKLPFKGQKSKNSTWVSNILSNVMSCVIFLYFYLSISHFLFAGLQKLTTVNFLKSIYHC